MGVIICCPDENNAKNEVLIDNQPDQNGDQYCHRESKTGTDFNFTNKKTTIKFDKGNFVRMKEDNIFDEYELKEKLGEGAYGSVYKVQQKFTNYLRAVKALKKKCVDSSEFYKERFCF